MGYLTLYADIKAAADAVYEQHIPKEIHTKYLQTIDPANAKLKPGEQFWQEYFDLYGKLIPFSHSEEKTDAQELLFLAKIRNCANQRGLLALLAFLKSENKFTIEEWIKICCGHHLFEAIQTRNDRYPIAKETKHDTFSQTAAGIPQKAPSFLMRLKDFISSQKAIGKQQQKAIQLCLDRIESILSIRCGEHQKRIWQYKYAELILGSDFSNKESISNITLVFQVFDFFLINHLINAAWHFDFLKKLLELTTWPEKQCADILNILQNQKKSILKKITDIKAVFNKDIPFINNLIKIETIIEKCKEPLSHQENQQQKIFIALFIFIRETHPANSTEKEFIAQIITLITQLATQTTETGDCLGTVLSVADNATEWLSIKHKKTDHWTFNSLVTARTHFIDYRIFSPRFSWYEFEKYLQEYTWKPETQEYTPEMLDAISHLATGLRKEKTQLILADTKEDDVSKSYLTSTLVFSLSPSQQTALEKNICALDNLFKEPFTKHHEEFTTALLEKYKKFSDGSIAPQWLTSIQEFIIGYVAKTPWSFETGYQLVVFFEIELMQFLSTAKIKTHQELSDQLANIDSKFKATETFVTYKTFALRLMQIIYQFSEYPRAHQTSVFTIVITSLHNNDLAMSLFKILEQTEQLCERKFQQQHAPQSALHPSGNILHIINQYGEPLQTLHSAQLCVIISHALPLNIANVNPNKWYSIDITTDNSSQFHALQVERTHDNFFYYIGYLKSGSLTQGHPFIRLNLVPVINPTDILFTLSRFNADQLSQFTGIMYLLNGLCEQMLMSHPKQEQNSDMAITTALGKTAHLKLSRATEKEKNYNEKLISILNNFFIKTELTNLYDDKFKYSHISSVFNPFGFFYSEFCLFEAIPITSLVNIILSYAYDHNYADDYAHARDDDYVNGYDSDYALKLIRMAHLKKPATVPAAKMLKFSNVLNSGSTPAQNNEEIPIAEQRQPLPLPSLP